MANKQFLCKETQFYFKRIQFILRTQFPLQKIVFMAKTVTVLYQTIQFSLSIQFQWLKTVSMAKTVLFQTIQFSF